MHIHTVFFWLKPGLDEEQIVRFEDGLRLLMTCRTVKDGYWGKPADTHREVVERSYSYGITLFFDTLAEHNAYQQDEDHLRFIERCSALWERVRVFDVQTGN